MILAALLGRQVLARLGTSIANDPGDPLLTSALLEWNAHHLPWSDAWWNFPIFHPTPDTLAFSEHLLGLSVVASPIAWLTGSSPITYNLTTLLTFPLSAMAMFALAYCLTRSAPAAFLAGLAFGFAPYRISNLPHVQMLASFWAPLALLGLHGYIGHVRSNSREGRLNPDATGDDVRSVRPRADGTGSSWWLGLYGAAWALQAAANGYMLVFFSVFIALWVGWFVIVPRRWRALGGIAAATAIAALPLAPILYKYMTVHALHNFERGVAEMRTFSADVAAVLCAPGDLVVWGWIRVACRSEGELFPGVALFAVFAAACFATITARAPLRDRGPEGLPLQERVTRAVVRLLLIVAAVYGAIVVSVLVLGPWLLESGFVRVSASAIDKPLLISLACAMAALLVALGRHAVRRESTLAFYLFAALVMWLFALGPTVTLMGELSGRPGPFALLLGVPGASGLRVPARFWLLTQMSLSIAAALFLARVITGAAVRRAVLAAALGIALAADGWAPPIPARDLPSPVPDARLLEGQVVLQLPVDPFSDMASTWRAVEGRWRAVNGYSGYGPNYYAALTLAGESADPALFTAFRRDHDLHVVVADASPDLKAATERQPGAVLVARGNGSTQYRLPRQTQQTPPRRGRPIAIAAVQSACAAAHTRLATDGDARTLWECVDRDEQQITIDLGTAAAVDAIVYTLGPYFWNPPVRLDIETSTDGARWSPARSGSVLGEFIEGGLEDPRSLRAVLRFPPRDARYIRIRPDDQREEFAWFVPELEVLGR